MNARQQRFVDEYLVDLNATRAAVRAGYAQGSADVHATRLLAHASVRAAIDAAIAKRSERTEITQDYVLKTIRETIERCSQARAVLTKKGEHVFVETPSGQMQPAYTFEPFAVLKGAELLAKHLGMLVDKKELTGKDGKDLIPNAPKGVLIVPGVMSEADWIQMMSERGA